MKLFKVVGPKGTVDTFTLKTEAKAMRRALNGVDADGNEKLSRGYYVGRGPDHYRGES